MGLFVLYERTECTEIIIALIETVYKYMSALIDECLKDVVSSQSQISGTTLLLVEFNLNL